MNAHFIDHPWMDEEFYETGSFISCDEGKAVLFCKGGEVRSAPLDNRLEEVTFIKKFFSDEYFIHIPREKLKLSLTELLRYLRVDGAASLSLVPKSNQDRVFEADFQRLKPLIPSTLSKAVLLSRVEFTASESDSLRRSIIARSFQLQEGRPYGFWHRSSGIVGCTPETLFEVKAGVIQSEALAGTALRGQERELLGSLKDRGEHDLVVRDIAEKLRSLDLDVTVGKTGTRGFSKIIHLHTPLLARARSTLDIAGLTARLTPTAALGGYPGKESMQFLQTMDYSKKFPDRIFGSVIGHLSSTSMALVMIRNLQWQGETFIIESGVGVVEASELTQELTELRMKREVVRSHYL